MFARTSFSTSSSEARKKGYKIARVVKTARDRFLRSTVSKLQFKFAETQFKITPTNTVFSES